MVCYLLPYFISPKYSSPFANHFIEWIQPLTTCQEQDSKGKTFQCCELFHVSQHEKKRHCKLHTLIMSVSGIDSPYHAIMYCSLFPIILCRTHRSLHLHMTTAEVALGHIHWGRFLLSSWLKHCLKHITRSEIMALRSTCL